MLTFWVWNCKFAKHVFQGFKDFATTNTQIVLGCIYILYNVYIYNMINWLTGEFQVAHCNGWGDLVVQSLRKKLGVRTCATVQSDLECKATLR